MKETVKLLHCTLKVNILKKEICGGGNKEMTPFGFYST